MASSLLARFPPCEQFGTLEFTLVGGETRVSRCEARYPLRFITPLANRQVDQSLGHAAWVFVLGFGGGMVSGDQVAFACTVRSGCVAVLTTQASTKIYKQLPDRPVTMQQATITLEPESFLVYAPEPVTCYENAQYEQYQHFRMDDSSTLILVDWFTSGRAARGESWAFTKYHSENRVFVNDKLVLWDNQILDKNRGVTPLHERMGPAHVVAMVYLYGKRAQIVTKKLQEDNAQARKKSKVSQEDGNLASSTSTVSGGSCFYVTSCSELPAKTGSAFVIRITSSDTELVRNRIRELLKPLASDMGGLLYNANG